MGRVKGVTLVEMLVCVAILAVVLGLAAPVYSKLVRASQTERLRDELWNSLQFARQQAVLGNAPVSLCPAASPAGCSEDGRWELGWLVFVDPDGDRACQDSDGDGVCDDGGTILRVVKLPARDGITLRGNHFIKHGVRFEVTGFATWNNGTFLACDELGDAPPRGLVIARTGRVRSASPACP